MYSGVVYRQEKGIPQGNNASPQIADLTLAMMEYRYISKYIKGSNKSTAHHHASRTLSLRAGSERVPALEETHPFFPVGPWREIEI